MVVGYSNRVAVRPSLARISSKNSRTFAPNRNSEFTGHREMFRGEKKNGCMIASDVV